MQRIGLILNAICSEQNSEWNPKENMDDKVPTDEERVSAEPG